MCYVLENSSGIDPMSHFCDWSASVISFAI